MRHVLIVAALRPTEIASQALPEPKERASAREVAVLWQMRYGGAYVHIMRGDTPASSVNNKDPVMSWPGPDSSTSFGTPDRS